MLRYLLEALETFKFANWAVTLARKDLLIRFLIPLLLLPNHMPQDQPLVIASWLF